MRSNFELADVLTKHWSELEVCDFINPWQLRTLGAAKHCRTSIMGGHKDACTDCGVVRASYNSCRNRHCPKCQGNQRELWIKKRGEELLPVPYFHVVFTLPDIMNQLAMYQPKVVYDILFEAAWGTIKTFGNDPQYLGAQTGDDIHITHLGTNPWFASTSALHRPGRWLNRSRVLETCKKQRQVPFCC